MIYTGGALIPTLWFAFAEGGVAIWAALIGLNIAVGLYAHVLRRHDRLYRRRNLPINEFAFAMTSIWWRTLTGFAATCGALLATVLWTVSVGWSTVTPWAVVIAALTVLSMRASWRSMLVVHRTLLAVIER